MVRNSAIKLLQPSLILRFPNIHQPWTLICHENESTKIILESFGFEFSKKHMCRSIFSGKESHQNRNIDGLYLFEYMPSYGNLCSSSLMRIQQSVTLDLITCRVYNRRSISRLAHLMLCNTNIYVCDITLISSVTESLYSWGGEQSLFLGRLYRPQVIFTSLLMLIVAQNFGGSVSSILLSPVVTYQ